ncbi:hypothetical protein HK096_011437 [Nowakowskiella sp. JEL0078]|nr:hypothetical protein HK096_011437 [Nowakowskiella sp. JEL0078]
MRILSRDNLPVIDKTQISKKVLADPAEIPVALSASKIPLPPLEILYGSNTGTAQDYATIVTSAAKNLGFTDISLSTLDNWKGFQKAIDGTLKEKTHVIIITATYNGQPPENADNFSKALQKIQASALKTDGVPFDGLSYTVFGCGNKQWRTYQSFPKSIDTAFENIGAKKFFHRGEGNADDDIETDFQKWFNELIAFLSSKFGIEISAPSRLTGTPEPITEGLEVKIIPIDSIDKIVENINGSTNHAVVLESRELQNISESGRSTRHIKFQLHESETYIPGDHLEVFPTNKKELVEQFASRAGLILDSSFEIKHISSTSQIGSRSLARTIVGPCTIRNALTNYADLLGPPSRTVLWALSDILRKDGVHKDLEHKFRLLSNPGSKSEYVEFVAKHRTILDVLRAYPEITQFPLAEFLCGAQVMAPRRYSISSSPNAVGAGVATVTVGIVQDVVPDSENVYPGLCSEYLSLLQPDQKVQASVRPCKDKAFRTPVEPDVPVVMIAAGTGVSPFLGFLQERKSAGFKSKEKGGVSSTVLYFGCRNEDDYIYREEIEQFVSEGTLDAIEVAYSRPKTNMSKKYVQHLLLENASKIWKTLIQEHGKIFICGSASGMAHDVLKTIENISQQLGGIEQHEAKNFVEKLQQEEKIVLDVWG